MTTRAEVEAALEWLAVTALHQDTRDRIATLTDALEAHRAEIALLRSQLAYYGVHFFPCKYGGTTVRVGPQTGCTCSLAAILNEAVTP